MSRSVFTFAGCGPSIEKLLSVFMSVQVTAGCWRPSPRWRWTSTWWPESSPLTRASMTTMPASFTSRWHKRDISWWSAWDVVKESLNRQWCQTDYRDNKEAAVSFRNVQLWLKLCEDVCCVHVWSKIMWEPTVTPVELKDFFFFFSTEASGMF